MTSKEYLNQLVKDLVKPALRAEGFSTAGTTFRKPETGFVKVFNLQHSQFNYANTASFYLNLGLFFPYSYTSFMSDWMREDVDTPPQPRITDCQRNFRVDALTNQPEVLLIDDFTDRDAFAERLRVLICDYALPYFRYFQQVEDFLEVNDGVYGQQADELPLAHVVIALHELGRRAEARELLRRLVESEQPADQLQRLQRAAQRHGIDV
ncbi:DUF4304 domain-containing protein [Hymenobacter gummosus]|nr:DUF4304 domain-containing protein [Hymenobacter gummosus]